MPPICSCGTELPEGARFCFVCGKPQREADVERMAPAVIATAAVPPPIAQAPTGVSFNNPAALRTALFVACLITCFEVVFPPSVILVPLVGGFGAVLLFQRRTGRTLNVASAVKLGWITAVLNVTFATIALTVAALIEGAAFLEPLREQIRQQAAGPAKQQAVQMMNDPFSIGMIVLMAWLLYFALISALCIAGGALGARLARPRAS